MSWAFCSSFQVSITKGSLTDRQITLSIPFALNTLASSLKRGRWVLEQVGVKAPGSANSTTVLPLNRASLLTFCHSPSTRIGNVTLGTFWPSRDFSMVFSPFRVAFLNTHTVRRPTCCVCSPANPAIKLIGDVIGDGYRKIARSV